MAVRAFNEQSETDLKANRCPIRRSHAKSPNGVPESVAPGITSPEKIVTSVQRSANATPYGFRDLLALDDFERHAKRHLPAMVFQYVAGAVETGSSLRAQP